MSNVLSLNKKALVLATIAGLATGLTACNKTQETANNASGPAPATALAEGTLDKIKKSGEIVLAHRDSSIPFSYIANKPNEPVGYAHDLQLKVVEAVKKQLNMPDLKVRYNLVTSQTRIPLIQNGTVDLECGSTTNNTERQQQVDFSVGFFEIGTRLLVAKDSGIKDFADLKGKTLVTTAGTTSERFIKQENEAKKMGINIVSAKDHGESFLMLENGRAAAFMMDDVLLAGEKAKAKDPAKWEIVGTPQSFEIYGCMMRKGDTAFKTLVDDTLKATYASGEINSIYSKWFTSPIPPKNVNMDFPMSDNLKALLASPHDKAEPQNATATATASPASATATASSTK
ncbi:glutamate/aspartate ABC transporter substrate-binding protein [Faucicola boevrei]|uniref:glutamate/aspartate ABC transporter substrate-binding protein n=1 Tax=Faucicola boevrei TaxID=346665 RepID=UPI000375B03D|nr:glutamate/aspartate ABC transporter substrate-binding protein [Moraxella boevrei]